MREETKNQLIEEIAFLTKAKEALTNEAKKIREEIMAKNAEINRLSIGLYGKPKKANKKVLKKKKEDEQTLQ